MIDQTRKFLETLFNEAVHAADPKLIIEPFIPEPPKGKTVVVGVGKAAAKLALALETRFKGALSGVVVTPYGYGVECKYIRVIEASHPLPDSNGVLASQAIFSIVKNLTSDDLVIALVCGGGSALLAAPPGNLTIQDEIILNKILLSSGLPISKMNLIRKHVSNIKGGKLALACRPAKVITLVLSDVPGDELYQVASGPTIADSADRERALLEVTLNNLQLPTNIMTHLNSANAESPVPNDLKKLGHEVHMIGSAYKSLTAAKKKAEKLGLKAFILSDSIEGESRDVANMHAAIVNQISRYDHPFERPVVLLSGGETTVALKDFSGRGGRNTEFLLAFILSLNASFSIVALAADTDGIDGSETNAGAFCDSRTLTKIQDKGLNARELLLNHNSYLAFEAADSLFFTGSTGTNVNDFRAILIT